jgi:cystathionine beta-lyase family protein involved in aluminum resistance
MKGAEMYESPITQILSEMQVSYENECLKAVQRVGFDVNKEELAKALMFDRNQYEKGYADGYVNAIDEFARLIIELNNEFPTVEDDYGEIRPMRIEEMCERISEQMKGEKE